MKTFKTIVLACFVMVFFAGCTGYHKYIEKNVPNGKCDSLVVKENFGPVLSLSLDVKGAVKSEGKISIEEATYDRTGNVTSAHVEVRGYERELVEVVE